MRVYALYIYASKGEKGGKFNNDKDLLAAKGEEGLFYA